MEPAIQYARTADGFNIAYWTLGEGPPLICLPPMPQHVQLDWRLADIREFYAWLARRRRLARFDFRGRGLSQRGNIDVSYETELLDFDAVVARLEIQSFVLIAAGSSAGAAIRYAARNPDRVEQLVLIDAVPPLYLLREVPWVRAISAVLPADYYTYTELVSYMIWGWQGGERTRKYAALLRDSVTHDQCIRDQLRNTREAADDLMRSLSAIRAPTLVIQHGESIFASGESIQQLVSEIAGARLVLLEGEAVGGSFGDPMMMAAVDEFLMSGDAAARRPEAGPAGTAVIMFADIAGSTLLTERMGDAAFRASARQVDEQIRRNVGANGGTTVEGKVMGDGVMAVFPSAANAIEAARACVTLSAESELALHVGLHAGDVIREENNVYGGAVNIAARVCEASTPGEILVSATVRDLARTSAGVAFEDRGERSLKGIEDPIRLFAILPQ